MNARYTESVEQLLARDETAIRKIRDLHTPTGNTPDEWPTCAEDGHTWPCPTYQAIEPEAVA